VAVDRRLSGLQMSPWMFWGALTLQLLFIVIMYRYVIASFLLQKSDHVCSVSVMQARDAFLTTYYDPFYPDLHLYTFKPIQHSMLSSGTPWLSIPDTLRREGWKASTGQIWDNLSIIVGEWQGQLWETWGNDNVQSNVVWPPT
jgi:serine/arginine repetitive matrix protein 2